jgi:hypothetical protein
MQHNSMKTFQQYQEHDQKKNIVIWRAQCDKQNKQTTFLQILIRFQQNEKPFVQIT